MVTTSLFSFYDHYYDFTVNDHEHSWTVTIGYDRGNVLIEASYRRLVFVHTGVGHLCQVTLFFRSVLLEIFGFKTKIQWQVS
jgi:hypothetical protein